MSPVLVHEVVGDFHRPPEIGIIGQQLETTARQFHDVQLLSALEVKSLHQLARKQQSI
ncbi:hypothetical protein ACVWZZ_002503 [Bradyrhizobium sp. LM6.10]